MIEIKVFTLYPIDILTFKCVACLNLLVQKSI